MPLSTAPVRAFSSIMLGKWLFRQPEIGENRRGLLRQAFAAAGCHGWQAVDHWQGYITLFVWHKSE
jgi:hypothetical protein